MPGVYGEFMQIVARFVDRERKERKAADRAVAAGTARGHVKAAKASEREQAAAELNRLRATGAISEAEYKLRHTRHTT